MTPSSLIPSDNTAQDYATRLAAQLAPLATRDGSLPTPVKNVHVLASHCSRQREPMIYEAGLVIIVQGGKVGYQGQREIHYGAGHYLVQAMPLPFECETLASTNEPLLGIAIELDRLLLAELVTQMPSSKGRKAPDPMAAVPIDAAFGEALVRLTECFNDEVMCRTLGQSRLREVVFAALRGQHGESLRRLVVDHGHYHKIAEAIQYMAAHYTEQMNVDQLARKANMSTSHFHHHFKVTTQLSPLQYLKRIRLLKAHGLLADGSMQVAQVSLAVGYHSNSQFSREYKHYFGYSPTRRDLRKPVPTAG